MAHAESERLARALTRVAGLGVDWSGFVYRSTSVAYANRDDLLTGAGAKKAGGRWNPPRSFHAVYASLEFETAAAEAVAHTRRYRVSEALALPRVFVALEVQVVQALDLRQGAVRSCCAPQNAVQVV